MENLQIRNALAENRMYQWELAEHLDISENALSRLLRRELPDDIQEGILNVIECVRDSKPFDPRFVREYMNFKKVKNRWGRHTYTKSEAYARKVAKGLDEAERRSLEGGWDLSL